MTHVIAAASAVPSVEPILESAVYTVVLLGWWGLLIALVAQRPRKCARWVIASIAVILVTVPLGFQHLGQVIADFLLAVPVFATVAARALESAAPRDQLDEGREDPEDDGREDPEDDGPA